MRAVAVAAVLVSLFLQLCRVAIALEPNLCDAKGTLQCDNYQTCCLFANGQHGCCPFTAANCCPALNSCCPAGFRCGNQTCLRMQP